MRRRLLLLVAATVLVGSATAEERLSRPAEWLREYLRIDTSNPPGLEHKAASYLAYLLAREKIEPRLLTTPGGRTNLYARLPATVAGGGGALLLTHHMDVVPAGPGWTEEPFAGTVKNGWLWGRGAIDTKSLGVAHLAALVDLKRSGLPRKRDVIFLAVADEELGGGEGMAWLWGHHPELFAGVEVVMNEGGSARKGAAGILWWEVEVAQKRPLWLRVTARGRPGHASAFEPESASHQLIRALDRLLARRPEYRLTPSVKGYFHAIGPLHRNESLRRAFSEIESRVTPEGPKGLIFPGLHRLLLDTLQVTVLAAGDSINVISPQAEARIDVRLLPDTDSEVFLARVREALGEDIEVEVLLSAPPAAPSPTGNAAWRAFAEGLGGDTPIVPAVASGFTDSRHFRTRGIAAYGVMPFALDPDAAAGIHAANERIPLAELDRGIERMRKIIESFVVR